VKQKNFTILEINHFSAKHKVFVTQKEKNEKINFYKSHTKNSKGKRAELAKEPDVLQRIISHRHFAAVKSPPQCQ